MNKDKLKAIFQEAKENKMDICVEVTIPGQEDTEYIINKNKSLDNKLEYYLRTYNENLEHCMNDRVKIVNCFSIDFYNGQIN